MSASIGDWHPLANYGLPSRHKQTEGLLHVFATTSVAASESHVTLTVQGDGIHVLDALTQHSLSTFTLGPSTSYTAPAVSRIHHTDSKRFRTTFAAIDTTPGLSNEKKGKTVYVWREEGDSVTSEPSRETVQVDHEVDLIFAPSSLPHAVLLSPNGAVTLLDSELSLSSVILSAPTTTRMKSWIFSRSSCHFLSPQLGTPRGSLLVCLTRNNSRLSLRLVLIDEIGGILPIEELPLQFHHEDLADMTFDPSGFISVLLHSGQWNAYSVSCPAIGASQLRPISSPLQLTALSFIRSQRTPFPEPQCSILAVGASHVLLCSLSSSSTPEIVTLLWDLQYSVLLASQTFKLPSALSALPHQKLRLQLVEGTSSTAVLLLQADSSALSKPKALPSSVRSTALVVPFNVPSTSSLIHALGRTEATSHWLAAKSLDSTNHLSDSQNDLLKTMESAMNRGHPEAASAAFFQWVDTESKAFSTQTPSGAVARPINGDASGARSDSEDDPAENLHPQKGSKSQRTAKLALSREFVSQVLHLILPPKTTASSSYSSRVFQYLLDRNAVSSSMIPGGLLERLLQYNDWESITLALKTVGDIPEQSLIMPLRTLITHHRCQSSPNAMDVDEGSTSEQPTPSVAKYLSLVVAYPATAPFLRMALKQHVTTAEDLVYLLGVAESWLERWCSSNVTLNDPSVEATRAKRQARRERVKGTEPLPRLDLVLSFVQLLLDSSFIILLQYPPAQPLLERLASHLPRQLSALTELEHLRGPLQLYAETHARARTKKEQPTLDGRKKRKEQQANSLSIGFYQVEELVL